MDAIILAGGVPKYGDPLWNETRGKHKVLMDICGKPMIQWVVDAANEAVNIHNIYVVGLPESYTPVSDKPLVCLPDQGGILENLQSASKYIIQNSPDDKYFLGISADIPLITGSMIDHIIERSGEPDCDIFYNIAPKSLMETVFPEVKRTYIRLKEGSFTGCDMHVMNLHYNIKEESAASKFVTYKKIPIKLIATLGFDILIRTLFNKPSIETTRQIIKKRTKIRVKIMISPFAEIGMDIDKPDQLAMIRKRLACA